MTTDTDSVTLADLRAIVGAEHAREAAEGDAVDGVRPRFVAAPGSVDEVSAVMRLAHGAGLAVAPRGGGTKLGWGHPPRRLDLIVSTERLNRVLEHAAGDLVVRAEAGVRLADLQRTVARAGQRLALNPPEEGATLGGTIAANASGYQRLRYGTVRDLLIGVTLVLADGTVARAGGRVVKNVAGYDLCKLFTGSLGTLGIIVETIFRLHPLPAARRTVAVELDTPEAAGAAVQELLHAPLSPLALDALEIRWTPQSSTEEGGVNDQAEHQGSHPGGDDHIRHPHTRWLAGVWGEASPQAPPEGAGGARGGEPDGVGAKEAQAPLKGAKGFLQLLVLFEGVEPGVVAQAETTAALLSGHGAPRILAADDEDSLWREASAYPWRGGAVGLKVTHPIAALSGVLQHIVEVSRAHGGAPRIASHAGSGVTLVGLAGDDSSTPAIIEGLRERVARVEGSVVVARASLDIKEGLDVWGPVGDALPLMQRVKERFDPAGILNPGRFVGGI